MFTRPNACYSDPKCQTFVDLNCKKLVGGQEDEGRYYWNVVEMEVFKFKES